MTEVEKRLEEIEADHLKLWRSFPLAIDIHVKACQFCETISIARPALKREAELQERHAALLTQNVQQEREIADLEQQVCSLREALDKFTSWYSEPNSFPDKHQSGERAYFQAREVLDSIPKCRHEEEKERADMLHDLLKLSQAQYNELLFAVCRRFPDESRHQTALRYIQEAEQRTELARMTEKK